MRIALPPRLVGSVPFETIDSRPSERRILGQPLGHPPRDRHPRPAQDRPLRAPRSPIRGPTMTEPDRGNPIQFAVIALLIAGGGWYFFRHYKIDGLDEVSLLPKSGEVTDVADQSFISYRSGEGAIGAPIANGQARPKRRPAAAATKAPAMPRNCDSINPLATPCSSTGARSRPRSTPAPSPIATSWSSSRTRAVCEPVIERRRRDEEHG